MADGTITIDTKLDNEGFKKGLDKIGSLAKTGFKTVAVSAGIVATAFAGIVAASVSARGELEQQIGGIETLFKDSAKTVIDNANKAYKTAGISAVKYMEQATSFSASLLQSVGGDTEKAAKVADMAIIDMADNANKMGTSIESIQLAYQGFAKQNYTMLDNLKLGYGGTKTEMQRLLEDASKLTGIKYDISNLNDVYEAIHIVQKELGITGTTALEASATLVGSVDLIKSAWENFLSGSGDLSQVVESAQNVVTNLVKIAQEAIPFIVEAIMESLPQLLELASTVLTTLINGIIEYLPVLMESASQILTTLINGIIAVLPSLIPITLQVIQTLAMGLLSYLPEILKVAMEIVPQILSGIAQMMPELIPAIVDCVLLMQETLIDNIDLLIDAAIAIMLGIVEGIIISMPKIIQKMPELIDKMMLALLNNGYKLMQAIGEIVGKMIIALVMEAVKLGVKWGIMIKQNIVDPLKNIAGTLYNIGTNIVQGIWNGIIGAKNWLLNKIKSFASTITQGIKDFFGIHSPSKVMEEQVGNFLPKGIGVGFEKEMGNTVRGMQYTLDLETSKMAAKVQTDSTYTIATQGAKDLKSNITIVNKAELDGRVVYENNKTYSNRQKLQYGY